MRHIVDDAPPGGSASSTERRIVEEHRPDTGPSRPASHQGKETSTRSVPISVPLAMATNLRLRPEAESALRRESERTGRSQQELIREALDRYLGFGLQRSVSSSVDELIATGVLRPARQPYRRASDLLKLPDGITSLDLLERDDRV